jgi:hypothetical protein
MSSIYVAQSIPIDLKKLGNNHSDAIPAEIEYLNFCNSDIHQLNLWIVIVLHRLKKLFWETEGTSSNKRI